MFAHGSPRDPVREYMLPRDIRDEAKMDANFQAMDRNGCASSATATSPRSTSRTVQPVPAVRTPNRPYDLGDLEKNRAIINVGSVGQPRDGDPRLSYVLFDGERASRSCGSSTTSSPRPRAIRAVPELPDYLADRLAAGR